MGPYSKSGQCVLPKNTGINLITLYVNFKTCYDVIHKTLPFVHLNLTTVKIIHLLLGLKTDKTIHMKIVQGTLISTDRRFFQVWHDSESALLTDLNTVTLMSIFASHLSLIILVEAFLSN